MPMPGLTPRQVFEDNLRPAELLLQIYTLLDCEHTYTEHEILDAMRNSLDAPTDESLLLLYNQLFVGIVRERAHVPHATFRKLMLDNLLRQAVAAACTALDAFLPALLRANIGTVLVAKRATFMPADKETQSFFQGIAFSLTEAVSLLSNPDPELFITNRILLAVKDKALGNPTAVHAIGSLLAIEEPWKRIGDRLSISGDRLKVLLGDTVKRRNDITHRADRSKDDPDGPVQDIPLSWTSQAVDNIKNICFALDELVSEQMRALRSSVTTT